MDCNDEAYDDLGSEESDSAYEPGHFTWVTPLILGVQVVEEMGQAVVDGLQGLKLSLCHHQNYRLQREAFAAEASRELDMILEGSEED